MAKHFTSTVDPEREESLVRKPSDNPDADNAPVGNKIGSPEKHRKITANVLEDMREPTVLKAGSPEEHRKIAANVLEDMREPTVLKAGRPEGHRESGMTAPSGAAYSIEQLKKGYDAEVKNFLKEKQVLSVIMKNCLEEFRFCSLDDITEKYIEGIPQVSAVAVDQDTEVFRSKNPFTEGFGPQKQETRVSDSDMGVQAREPKNPGRKISSAETSETDHPHAELPDIVQLPAGSKITGMPNEDNPSAETLEADHPNAELSDIVQLSAGSKITGMPNEDNSVNEGRVTYDIRFTALAPAERSCIKLMINVEAQNHSKDQSYPIVKRGFYYCARMISAQKNAEFQGMHYENIKKVYSIWICQGVPKDREHSIALYDIQEHILVQQGNALPGEKAQYDLMSVIVLGLGDPEAENKNDALRMLSIALSNDIPVDRKKRILSDEFHIAMTETMEGTVNRMCNLSDGIEERADARGESRGKLLALYELVKKGLLSLCIAAREANQTEAEFRQGMEAYFARQAAE